MLAAWVLAISVPTDPVGIGRAEIDRAADSKASHVSLRVVPGERESFRITAKKGGVDIVGGDKVGAMYGAFEFAERLRMEGAGAWNTNFRDRPFLPERGLNLFLTLPWNYAKNDTDYDLAALTDPNRWWFENEDYWTTLLDLMAHSRLNWLDIHGTWDISVTDAPNLYAYFIQSDLFPKVGVPPDVKAAELRQLNHVIDMAHQRGIKVSLMSYQADLRIPQNKTPPYEPSESNIYAYTREVVEKMIRQAPGLDAIGFRIGESGKSESFFKCYEEAVKRSGRDIPLITRSWVAKRQQILPLARASKDFSVEIKYNGEHWGAPYPVAGGRVANWYSYSFEDYLSDAGQPELNAKTWPGWPGDDVSSKVLGFGRGDPPATGGGYSAGKSTGAERWPSEPYKIVWQVRANGTHRIFPFYSPLWTRSTILAMKMGTASGYTVEGMDAYFPKSPDYYLANQADKYCNWIHQRDEMYWMCWGRLGYDPETPNSTFDRRADELLGFEANQLIRAWELASADLSYTFLDHSLGPDHRSHAPELEWGGDTDAFIHGQGFDTFALQPLEEKLANRATGGVDGRNGPFESPPPYTGPGLLLGAGPQRSIGDAAVRYLNSSNGRVKEIAKAVQMMSALHDYSRYRWYSADQLATIENLSGGEFKEPSVDLSTAVKAHEVLAGNYYYKPFTDRLRMHTNSFSWTTEHQKLVAEAARIDALKSTDVTVPGRPMVTGSVDLQWAGVGSSIRCIAREENFELPIDHVWLLYKPLPSSTFFHKFAMQKVGGHYEVTLSRPRCGLLISAEAANGTVAARSRDGIMPYQIVPARSGPTPQIYNASEAMTYLRPEILKPEKFGGLLIGERAGAFFGSFDRATKRKLLVPVERGMRLVILQEDFTRDKLDWLPKPLGIEVGNWGEFDPAGAFDLPKVELPGIMWQRFAPSDGWQIFGNGGLAQLAYGKGEIVVCNARVMQNMQYPNVARAFVDLLGLGGKDKPTVLVDSCSESADTSSSCYPDLMNSHGIPFLTLGEAIAQEQGMNSFTPIPGPVLDDDVLGGKGSAMATKFLRDRVIALSHRATPTDLGKFEVERARRRAELKRSLGLDPMPPRTPLNVRHTGVIQRDGYRIEKIAFESRPRFYVTAHVYVPDHPTEARMPAIVNVNGHWEHKKDEDRIQLRCAFQALRGYVAMAVDSPGFSFEGDHLIERRAEGTHLDFKLVEGGSNATGYYVWDVMRAVDYLSTRPDVDMNRLGITGASGGGLATLYAFAADDRFKVAVPVVYLASLELAPDNGCLCNHVPGTCQIGDRSDVAAIQAPKPVLIMGAEQDGEFPPEATRLTRKKMAESWALFGKAEDVQVKIFPGGHDYNQGMRESMIGFFDKYLRGVGDGSPVPQPALTAIDPEDRQLLALDPPAPDERTMRDLSQEYLSNAPNKATFQQVLEVNGGLPEAGGLKYREFGTGSKRQVVLESEPGLQTPGILCLPVGPVKGIRIVAADIGKVAEMAAHPFDGRDGYAVLYLDVLGTGELGEIEMRYAVYAGRSMSFTAGWQIARAAAAMGRYSEHVEVVGRGALSSQAVMYAGLMDSGIEKVTGIDCLRTWSDVFQGNVSDYAVQPRAHLCGSLEELRNLVRNGAWIDK